MAGNAFEGSRVAAGTLDRGSQKPGVEGHDQARESQAISRDDVRDGGERERGNNMRVLAASTLSGDRVRNSAGEELGRIEEIMLDVPAGRIAYAVLSFGGFLGMGDKLFAVPWSALKLDTGEHEFILDVSREQLEKAPGFDKNDWPNMADPVFGEEVHRHYGAVVYWEHTMTDAGDYMGDNEQGNKSRDYEPTTGYQAGGRKKQTDS